MYDALFMSSLEGFGDLGGQAQSFLDTQEAFSRLFLQGLSPHLLQGDKGPRFSVPDVVDL